MLASWHSLWGDESRRGRRAAEVHACALSEQFSVSGAPRGLLGLLSLFSGGLR